jgi:hypothetical protein
VTSKPAKLNELLDGLLAWLKSTEAPSTTELNNAYILAAKVKRNPSPLSSE